jgi:hypothetical protein
MISFARPDQLEIAAEVCQSFCFDNGAFTAWRSGKAFDMEGFADFVEGWHMHPGFDFYIMPDKIDGDHIDNLKMIARWREVIADHKIFEKGVPVWHLHEPLDVLENMVHAYPRVALGSSGEYSKPGVGRWWNRMAEAMSVATDSDGFPRAKLHGLRMLDPTIFSHIPLASADSTNVGRSAGINDKWNGTYTPKTKETRALIMMERIEAHACAIRWAGSGVGAQPNMELFG